MPSTFRPHKHHTLQNIRGGLLVEEKYMKISIPGNNRILLTATRQDSAADHTHAGV